MATWQMCSGRLEASIQYVTRGVDFGFISLTSAPGFPPSTYADLTRGTSPSLKGPRPRILNEGGVAPSYPVIRSSSLAISMLPFTERPGKVTG
jgi:hypothetical protein